MKKELKMKHIFIPVIVVVVILAIVAVFLSNSGKVNTPTDGTFVDENGASYHVHDDGSIHYDEH